MGKVAEFFIGQYVIPRKKKIKNSLANLKKTMIILWPFSGILLHIVLSTMKFGFSIWEEPMTYLMFIPAMIAGPTLILVPLYNN